MKSPDAIRRARDDWPMPARPTVLDVRGPLDALRGELLAWQHANLDAVAVAAVAVADAVSPAAYRTRTLAELTDLIVAVRLAGTPAHPQLPSAGAVQELFEGGALPAMLAVMPDQGDRLRWRLARRRMLTLAAVALVRR